MATYLATLVWPASGQRAYITVDGPSENEVKGDIGLLGYEGYTVAELFELSPERNQRVEDGLDIEDLDVNDGSFFGLGGAGQ